jgi:regulator of CtrA degradation
MTASTKTAFFHRTYDEVLALLVEARDYVAGDKKRTNIRLESLPMSPGDRLLLCSETFRLTSRLTYAMAWLMAQRAVHAGEITREQAASDAFCLGGHAVCTAVSSDIESVGDAPLLGLLDRSLKLYERVARLDELVRDSADRPAARHAQEQSGP